MHFLKYIQRTAAIDAVNLINTDWVLAGDTIALVTFQSNLLIYEMYQIVCRVSL